MGPWYKIGKKEGVVFRAYGKFNTTTITGFFGRNSYSFASEMIYGAGLTAGVRL